MIPMRARLERGRRSRLPKVLFGLNLLFLLFVGIWILRQNAALSEAAHSVAAQASTPQDEVLAVLDYTSQIDTLSVRSVAPEKLDDRARFYRALPFNLIPPGVVLEHGLSYSGPCGAKSKLTVAMLDALGYDARLNGLNELDFTPQHTIVEVRLEDAWRPIDPTFGLAFLTEDGVLADTQTVRVDDALFRRSIAEAEASSGIDYPEETYVYDNMSAMSVFYVLHRLSRIVGLTDNADAPAFFRRLDARLPESLLRYDLGAPFFYERPELLPLLLSFAFGIVLLPFLPLFSTFLLFLKKRG